MGFKLAAKERAAMENTDEKLASFGEENTF